MATKARRKKPSHSAGGRRVSAPKTTRRASWSGLLRLALVTIPVELHPATASGARLSFHQVHGPTGKRIRYEKVVPGLGPVKSEDILKGYEVARGQYVLLEPEEIDAVKLEASRTFNLVQFVDRCEIDPLYFERPYYVTPEDAAAEESYRVLRDALRDMRKIGLGQIIMQGREHIGALQACGSGMVLEILRYADEVRAAAPLFADIGKGKSDPELLDLAKELVERRAAPFDAAAFQDRYSIALKELVDAKLKKTKPSPVGEEELPAATGNVIDLVQALRESVRTRGDKRRAPASRARRKAG